MTQYVQTNKYNLKLQWLFKLTRIKYQHVLSIRTDFSTNYKYLKYILPIYYVLVLVHKYIKYFIYGDLYFNLFADDHIISIELKNILHNAVSVIGSHYISTHL